MSCGEGYRCGSDLALLWLWCRAAATAPIRPLAWEPPYAVDVALEDKKAEKKKQKKNPSQLFSRQLAAVKMATMGQIITTDMFLNFFYWIKFSLEKKSSKAFRLSRKLEALAMRKSHFPYDNSFLKPSSYHPFGHVPSSLPQSPLFILVLNTWFISLLWLV